MTFLIANFYTQLLLPQHLDANEIEVYITKCKWFCFQENNNQVIATNVNYTNFQEPDILSNLDLNHDWKGSVLPK